jgi:hypothetical protein
MDRGIELHVWFNPYRAHHPAGGEITDASNCTKTTGSGPRPGERLSHGSTRLNPAPRTLFKVVMDVVAAL